MVHTIDASEFETLRLILPVVDVRSPGEYNRGHVPSSVSVPVFSDEERAAIGTVYKQVGKKEAIALAMETVLPKQELFLSKIQEVCGRKGYELLLHCWRGGMRSGEFSKFLSAHDFKVHLLTGGYKAYRQVLHNGLGKPWKLLVIGGMTGAGKTAVLRELIARGRQAVCLERLAKHKGSAFGALGQGEQPSTEQFQNDLWEVWHGFDQGEPVFVEDESQAIGSVRIPDELYANMRGSPVVKLELTLERRAERLVKEYGGFDKNMLKERVLKISRRLGDERTTQAVIDLEQGKLQDVAVSVLRYYDKAYTFGLSKRDQDSIGVIQASHEDMQVNADAIERYVDAKGAILWKK